MATGAADEDRGVCVAAVCIAFVVVVARFRRFSLPCTALAYSNWDDTTHLDGLDGQLASYSMLFTMEPDAPICSSTLDLSSDWFALLDSHKSRAKGRSKQERTNDQTNHDRQKTGRCTEEQSCCI